MRTTTGVLLGALSGIALGLLIAPKKGKDLRHDISDTTGQWKTKWNKMLGKTDGKIDELRKILNREVRGLGEDVRQRMLNIIDEATEKNYSAQDHNGSIK
jgi:gas vesicle protein